MQNNNLTHSLGNSAGNYYLNVPNGTIQLLLDFSYDSVDIKFFNDCWININENTILKNEYKEYFKVLANYALKNSGMYINNNKTKEILIKFLNILN